MGTDALALLRIPSLSSFTARLEAAIGARVTPFLRRLRDGACVFSTLMRYPREDSERAPIAALLAELRREPSTIVVRTGGVLVFPDTSEYTARTYTGVVRQIGSEGTWFRLSPTSHETAFEKSRESFTWQRRSEVRRPRHWACLLVHSSKPLSSHQAGAHDVRTLSDGTQIIVAKELISDLAAVTMMLFGYYPHWVEGHSDARGVLCFSSEDLPLLADARHYRAVVQAVGARAHWLAHPLARSASRGR